ncbi:MAG: ABC transporter substrate-binding protein, partial [Candidatus Hermodarchaeota archaeon]
MQKKAIILIGVLFLALVGLAVGVSTPIQAPATKQLTGTVEVGFMYPITGGLAPIAEGLIDGANAGVYRVNQLYDFDIELVIEDSGSEAQVGTIAATNLVAAGVEVVIGAAASGASLAAAAVLVPEEIPQISYASTSPALTIYNDSDFLFRTVASDVFQGQALA